MKKKISLFLFVFILLSSLSGCSAVKPTQVSSLPPTLATVLLEPTPKLITYASSSSEVLNPERGFYQVALYGMGLADDDLSYVTNTGDTLVSFEVRLDNYRDSDITSEYLQELDLYFQNGRNAGVKFMIRVSYNFGNDPDASLDQVLRHIEQLAPVFEKNKDVIAWFQAGFIGAWGEWHSSINGLDTDENKAIIRNELFAAFPRDRPILFRYPKDIIKWYPDPLTDEQAFSNSNQSRTGHHNDCFLASEDDQGTYPLTLYGENISREEWQAYISQMTRFVPMIGETCSYAPPRSDCKTALVELELMHWTSINDAFKQEVLQSWKNQGCYLEIRNRLGYRLTLLNAEFSPLIKPERGIQIRINLRNVGFASPQLARPVYMVLIDQGGLPAYRQVVDVDLRRWEPGDHAFNVSVSFPKDLPNGRYQIALWLPDPALNLQKDSRYAIQFANLGIWNAATGWNMLGEFSIAGEVTID